eukprot:2282980-Alexandrium_andersonii.AAC.1
MTCPGTLRPSLPQRQGRPTYSISSNWAPARAPHPAKAPAGKVVCAHAPAASSITCAATTRAASRRAAKACTTACAASPALAPPPMMSTAGAAASCASSHWPSRCQSAL